MTSSTNTPGERNVIFRLVRRGLFGQFVLAALLFIPAGTMKYWQAWAFMILNFVIAIIFCTYFYRHDRQLLERRMLTKEKIGAQKFIILLLKLLSVLVYALCGFDFRFGWTREYLAPVPWWLVALALVLYSVCYLGFVSVMRANRFAASIIQTEAGQTVAADGPYRWVRHPMYSVGIGMWFCAPPALGSLVALPAALLIIPILIFRLLNEEKFLRRDLPGYVEYCQRTRYRLLPFVW